MNQIQKTIEDFVHQARRPCLCEPGEPPIALSAANFTIALTGAGLRLEAWDDKHNLSRRIIGLASRPERGRLTLTVEKFGKKTGALALIDLASAAQHPAGVRHHRQEFQQRFARFLRRQFPAYSLDQLSTSPDLHASLSPFFPRALLHSGATAWAAIAAPADPLRTDGVLSFGLIWLDYLRQRQPGLRIAGLILYLPAELSQTTCLRVAFLDRRCAQYRTFLYDPDGEERETDPADHGNLDTHLQPWSRPGLEPDPPWMQGLPDVESVPLRGGGRSFQVHGLEFGRGLVTNPLSEASNRLIQRAEQLSNIRVAGGKHHELAYRRNPEAWLESQVRKNLEMLHPNLLQNPVYGQVPAFTAADRGMIDLLASDRDGRLTVIELKASEDLHLPLQALDYWLRVKWHLDRREFTQNGYFPGIAVRSTPPKLMLVSPALEIHPTNERVLSYFSPEVEVEQVGVSVEWRKQVKVVFRTATTCH